jgi:prepilin-type N-terminal cleavage/methylation domain-containing protein
MPSPPHIADRSKARRGFTLVELMVVTVIIGVMAAMSVPSFQRAIEQSRADIAAANLRAIWAAERLYWLEYHTYTPAAASPVNPDPAMQSLSNMGLIDTEIVSGAGGYTYAVTEATTTSFTATATRTTNSNFFSINESGNVSGSISFGGSPITPGFQ